MQDLGTFGRGAFFMGEASGLNDFGHVTGHAEDSGSPRVLSWRDGRLTAIGPELSIADGAFRDLNQLIPAGSGVRLENAGDQRRGLDHRHGSAQGGQRAFVLIPR